MSSDQKDKWLEKVRNQVEDYREPLPDGFWASIERDIPAPVPVWWKRKGAVLSFLSAAAAVAVLFLILLPEPPEKSRPAGLLPVTVAEKLPEAGDGSPLENLLAELPVRPAQAGRNPAAERSAGTLSGNGAAEAGREAKKPQRPDPVRGAELEERENPSGSGTPAAHAGLSGTEAPVERENAPAGDGTLLRGSSNAMPVEDGTEPGRRERGRRTLHLAFHAGNSGLPRAHSGVAGFNSDRASNALMGDMSFSNLTELKDNISRFDGQPAQIYNYRHHQPFKAGVAFAFGLGKGFSLETGLTYQFLKSCLESGTDEMEQRMHYLGIPVRANWSFVRTRHFTAYVGAGALFEKCLHADIDGTKVAVKGIQSSLNAMVGAQYNISRHAAVYFEPGICYYLGMKDDGVLARDNGYVVKNVYSEEPLGLTLSAGFRFSF